MTGTNRTLSFHKPIILIGMVQHSFLATKLRPGFFLGTLVFLFLFSCSKDDGPGPDPDPQPGETLEFIVDDDVKLNPSGYAPLSALITLETTEAVSLTMSVKGQDGGDSDVVQAFGETATQLSIPVHGLYAGASNEVRLTFFSGTGENLGTQAYLIQTLPISTALPQITIQVANRSALAEGMTLVSYFGHNGAMFPQRPFIFDSYGKIRWYLDFSNHPMLGTLFYDNGIERLANGNFYFGSGGNNFGATADNRIYEIDLFGNVVNSWEMPGFGFHHEVHEKPNGNFLVTVNKLGAATIEDHVIEIDRESGEIINEWNLNQSLENGRTTWTTDTVDWIHINGVYYDPSDDTIVVSGRTQGVVKLTADNQVVWILAPHKDWGQAGNGQNLDQYLLQPLNAQGQAINDISVLEGDINHPEFEWPWYPHAPAKLPDGSLMLFDNGDTRNYSGTTLYSRAVRYEIDAAAMTVRQQWQYGKERGAETYSRIVSDVDFLEAEGHVIFSPGAIQAGGANSGKSVEVDSDTGEVLFEATVTPPIAFFDIITLHRTERLPLYPE